MWHVGATLQVFEDRSYHAESYRHRQAREVSRDSKGLTRAVWANVLALAVPVRGKNAPGAHGVLEASWTERAPQGIRTGQGRDDCHYWKKELEDPCLMILTRTRSPTALVDDDVSIADEPAAKRQRTETPETVQKSAWETSMGSKELPTKRNNAERFHSVNDGTLSTNRRGVARCTAFNAGTRKETWGRTVAQ